MRGSDLTAMSYSDGDIDTNRAANPDLQDIVAARYSRRQTLFGGMSATVAAFLPVTLTACDDDDDPQAPAVTVNAVQPTSSGKAVALAGTATDADGSVASYAWTQTSGPPVTVANANTAAAMFIAPSVSAATPLGFRLTAADDGGAMASSDTTVMVNPAKLDFTAVPKSLEDKVSVPTGYTVTVLYRLGDPITAGTAAYANDGTDTIMSQRAGDHHDGMSFFGLAATSAAPDPANSTRGLLVLNHENINQSYLHPNGPTVVNGARPEAEALKEIECHGVSVIEITRAADGAWSYVQGSPLNRRITPLTPTILSGPVRGAASVRTRFSPDGTAGRGTINNCANGYTPWNSYLTNEENWAGYFRRDAGDDAVRTAANGAKAITALARYGLGGTRRGNYGWTTVVPADSANTGFAKFNITVDPAAPADGTTDFRNEANQFGWVMEVDPFDPASTPRKRTALGRMNHEGCWPSRFVAGRRPAFYMGDDAQNEYVYKFVSATPWTEADAPATDRLAIGDKYLDAGTLYVAKFNADGSGSWLPLVFGQGPLTQANPAYPFADQADVLVHARLAADAVGATRMDRPEWTTVNPVTGEMYLTLTNNTSRTIANTDAANPRYYADPKAPQGDQVNVDPPSPPVVTRGNANGHILRLRETGDTTEATGFAWDIYAFGAGSDLDPTNINLSGLDASNDFSSPDGLWFSRSANPGGLVTPLLWIETDDGAYTDITNCMLLCAMPGTVGDGGARTITNTGPDGATRSQATILGKAPGASLRRFLVGPKECEITGIDSTPDGRSLFVNIQHPGENGSPAKITSNWPANQAGTPAPNSRPRSATIVITKDDGGVVGL